MKKILYFIATCLIITLGYSCSKEDRMRQVVDPNAPAPAQVTDVKVKENSGGAILTYKIPADPNLLYVKAVYEIQPGVFREAKSSIYTDTLSLVGFGDTLSHEVKLYSVGKNEKASEPVSIQVSPQMPSVKSVFKTLQIRATFAGVNVSFQNDSKANLSIVVMVDSSGFNTWSPVTTFYTAALKGSFSVRGFEPKEKKFAVFLRDRWNNKSDTLISSLTPLFEELIPKNDFKAVYLPTDTYDFVESFAMPGMWDGKLGYNMFATQHTALIPQWCTIDLGKKTILSRMKEFQYHESPYAGASVKSFEIWGSNDPDKDGGWNNWQLLGTFKSFKPSGKPYGSNTADDVNYAINNGEDFEFTDNSTAFRFIRFKTTETWGGGGQVVIVELTFWGQLMP